MLTEGDRPIRFRPVLYIASANGWRARYWSDSAQRWNHIRPSTPLAERPQVEMDVGLDATLMAILEAACDAWGLISSFGHDRRHELVRFAFVEEEADRDGISEQAGYKWPNRLPAPNADGSISMISGRDVTVRQLLAAKQLELLSGDVTRPYVYPVSPQGAGQVIKDLAPIAPEIVRAAFMAVRGLEGGLIQLISASKDDLHRADQYVSGHPLESAAGADAARRLGKRLKGGGEPPKDSGGG